MLKRSLVLAALCGMSFAATAVTIDLRHEFIELRHVLLCHIF